MRRITVQIHFLALLLVALTGKAQTTWHFGEQASVKFNNGVLNGTGTAPYNAGEGTTLLVDGNNNVILSSNGINIWNGVNQQQNPGSILLAGASSGTQTVVAVPIPGSNNQKAFIFTTYQAESSYGHSNEPVPFYMGLRATLVDITGTAPNCSVNVLNFSTDYNKQITPQAIDVGEKLEVTEDGNGGYWVLTHGIGIYEYYPGSNGMSNSTGERNFYAFHITYGTTSIAMLQSTMATSVFNAPLLPHQSWSHPYLAGLSLSDRVHVPELNAQGQLRIHKNSATSAIVATTLPYAGNTWGESGWRVNPVCQLFNFSLTTGALTNPLEFNLGFNNTDGIEKDGAAVGVEISPSGRYLYISSTLSSGNFVINPNYPTITSRIYQYDLQRWDATSIEGTKQLVIAKSVSAFNGFGALQKGPNGHVYIANMNQHSIGEIPNPDIAAPGCGYIENAVTLTGLCKFGLPTTIIVPTTSGIASYNENSVFSVSPNPSRDIFSIQLINRETATIKVVDLVGNIIKTAQLTESSNFNLDLSGYAKGMYIVIVSGKQIQMQKIILE